MLGTDQDGASLQTANPGRMMLSDELLQQAREAAKAYHLRVAILLPLSMQQDDGLNVVVFDSAIPPERIRVEGSQQKSMLIEETATGHLGEGAPRSGVVKLAVVIGKDGTVIEVDSSDGPESLISSAVAAVKRWKYKPTLLNGRPVEVETTVEVNV
jgi:TonB family protein